MTALLVPITAAAVPVAPVRSARPVVVGADSPELLANSQSHLCCRGDSTAGACVSDTASSGEPSGGGLKASDERTDETAQRTVWTRRDWKSTAAFTIGKPPRAPRAG